MYRNQRKAAIGVVTTVPFSHATPAGFVSHNKSRNNYLAISSEIINSVKPEVVIGGGHPALQQRGPGQNNTSTLPPRNTRYSGTPPSTRLPSV